MTGGDRGRGQVNRDRPVRGRDSGSGFSGRGRDAGRAFGRGRTGEPHQNGRGKPATLCWDQAFPLVLALHFAGKAEQSHVPKIV